MSFIPDLISSINITHQDGSCHTLEQKDHIKYLGVMIDITLTWKYHISYVSKAFTEYRSNLYAEALSTSQTPYADLL